jgi:hypothetical protein
MSRLTTLLILILFINLSISVVNAYFVNSNGQPLFLSKVQPYQGWGINNVTSGAQCVANGTGSYSCSPTPPSSGAGGVLSSILFFGDYFGAMVRFIGSMIEGVVLPYFFLVGWGVPPLLAGIFNAGMWIDYLYFFLMLLSGRPIEG